MQQSFETIKQLVADFKAQEAAYLSPTYQESQVRQDFIDKFFAALGWDVTHVKQRNPYEQEVHIENKVKMAGSSQRRADYAFFLSPNFRDPTFFVEAKKPSRNLANADDYYQAIRYGWNAKTPLAILTDFEEFHILDCRFKPDINDALNRKVASFHYTDYADNEKFAYINYLFSRDAVATGAIEKRATELLKPRGKGGQKGASKGAYQAVDEAFLEELDEYRITLAKAFKKANEKLEGEELTEAVQRTIDRLVFIRFLEDKGIEEKAIINLKGQKSAWKAFINLCKRCEPKYNGLVFKPHRILDEITLDDSEDKAFAQICAELADPGSPYDFNQIPISILGSIYERFLGKVVHATDKRVKVEEKPEVRKAGGVYYTPEYIVRYIVKETVGKLIEGKTPAEIAPMAFADIACGSGSFLIEVYAQLLDYHVRYYLANPEKVKIEDVFERDGKLQLTLKKKKEILLNNIYGVDIDFQATEVTQLSLYLKLLEDATLSEAHQFGLFKETILPDLKQNIVCGNSLVGRDISDGSLFPNLDESKLKPMNVSEVFPSVMKRGGFDAIVGNPPYIRIQTLNETLPEAVTYYKKSYRAAGSGNYDIYVVFIERAFRLIANSGRVGYIVPNKFFRTDYGAGIRTVLSDAKAVEKIVDFGVDQVFDVTTYTCILLLSKYYKSTFQLTSTAANAEALEKAAFESRELAELTATSWNLVSSEAEKIEKQLAVKSIRLLDIPADMSRGSSSGDDEVFVVGADQSGVEEEILRTPVFATDFKRYHHDLNQEWRIIYPYILEENEMRLLTESELEERFPKAYSYLKSNQALLKKRKQYSKWYGFSAPRNLLLHENAQILVPLLADRGSFAPVPDKLRGRICPMASGGFTIAIAEKSQIRYEYVLGLLNSGLLFWKLRQLSNVFRGGWITCTKQYFGELPIRVIDLSNRTEVDIRDNIVGAVQQIMQCKDKISNAKTESERNRLELQCESLDRQIDQAVYELYGLTEEEIKIVEGSK